MRIAGAAERFPYSQSHATYIAAALSGRGYALQGHAINEYAPAARRPDLRRARQGQARAICATAEIVPGPLRDRRLRFCGQLSAISGNVDAAVTLTHVPILPDGRLGAEPDRPVDDRYHWIVVLQVLYDK